MSRLSDPRFIIYLVPIGQVNRETLEFLANSVTACFIRPCFILPPIELPMGIARDCQSRIDALEILDFLVGRMPADGSRIVWVMTGSELYSAGLGPLDGCSRAPYLAAVVTLKNLRDCLSPNPDGL
ncbi:MAG: hypothetical protein AAB731_01300, partial [Patescibacteria group bacterium]